MKKKTVMGRKPMFGKTLNKIRITVEDRSIAIAKRIGKGNVSAGFRAAADMADDYMNQKNKS